MVTIDDLLGYVVLTVPPMVYGEQPAPSRYQRFDRRGRLVEDRVVPPMLRIDYGAGA